MGSIVPRAEAMLRPCSASGCGVLTLGLLCVRHEPPPSRILPRGRPFARLPAGPDTGLPRAQLRLPRKISA
jgi:hypothetical protein